MGKRHFEVPVVVTVEADEVPTEQDVVGELDALVEYDAQRGTESDSRFTVIGVDTGKPQIEAFTFDQLDAKARERVRDWYMEGMDGWVVDIVTDTLRTELTERGLDGLTESGPWWELYVQGGGVAFEGRFTLDTIKPIVGTGQEDDADAIATILKAAPSHTATKDWTVTVKASNQGMHFTVEASYAWPDWDAEDSEIEAAEENVAEAVHDWLTDLARTFMRMAEDEYEYQSSDEAVRETCEANEYLFTRTGEPVHHLLRDNVREVQL